MQAAGRQPGMLDQVGPQPGLSQPQQYQQSQKTPSCTCQPASRAASQLTALPAPGAGLSLPGHSAWQAGHASAATAAPAAAAGSPQRRPAKQQQTGGQVRREAPQQAPLLLTGTSCGRVAAWRPTLRAGTLSSRQAGSLGAPRHFSAVPPPALPLELPPPATASLAVCGAPPTPRLWRPAPLLSPARCRCCCVAALQRPADMHTRVSASAAVAAAAVAAAQAGRRP